MIAGSAHSPGKSAGIRARPMIKPRIRFEWSAVQQLRVAQREALRATEPLPGHQRPRS
jgi:hypothetical protein